MGDIGDAETVMQYAFLEVVNIGAESQTACIICIFAPESVRKFPNF
jgi:hypothetical protein